MTIIRYDLGVMQFWEQGTPEGDDKIFKRSIPMWISWGIFVMKCNFGNELTEPEWDDFIFKSILKWMRCGMFLVFWESPEWYNYISKRRPLQKCHPFYHSSLEVEIYKYSSKRCFYTKWNQWAITLKVFSIPKKYSQIKKIRNFLGAMQFGSPVHCGWPSSSINFNLTISWKRIGTIVYCRMCK